MTEATIGYGTQIRVGVGVGPTWTTIAELGDVEWPMAEADEHDHDAPAHVHDTDDRPGGVTLRTRLIVFFSLLIALMLLIAGAGVQGVYRQSALAGELAPGRAQLAHAPGLVEQLGDQQCQLITVVTAQVVFAVVHGQA
mgnify:CR=1 FL=1